MINEKIKILTEAFKTGDINFTMESDRQYINIGDLPLQHATKIIQELCFDLQCRMIDEMSDDSIKRRIADGYLMISQNPDYDPAKTAKHISQREVEWERDRMKANAKMEIY